jgi:aldehyde:ferredoxin oxidoreductase
MSNFDSVSPIDSPCYNKLTEEEETTVPYRGTLFLTRAVYLHGHITLHLFQPHIYCMVVKRTWKDEGVAMAGGYTGKILVVNLSSGSIEVESPEDDLYRNFIGGYGVGARFLYSRQKGGVKALGPLNTLGIVTGPLTGTPATFGCRFAVVGKSPLTGGWGDANCGGHFGPFLKFAGYDAIFITGTAERPVYLFVDNGRGKLNDASDLWGKDTFETDERLQNLHGRDAKVLSIGPAGEKCSLISCLITFGGSAAGRSGLGSLMGSKKLKAVVVKGSLMVPIADIQRADRVRRRHLAEIRKALIDELHTYGTSVHTDSSAHSGDTPVKNWRGIGVLDLPDVSDFSKDVMRAKVVSRTGCWRCPVACRGKLKAGSGNYLYPPNSRRPEYETMAAFGAMCLNNNADAVIMANHICDSYGLDTISTGTTIAFAMECYEQGLLTSKDTDGIELRWGNHRAMVAMTEKLAKREGFGDVLADGVQRAAEKIGGHAVDFAVHIGGQELGLHDPKFDFPAFSGKPTAARFKMDAAPGRHTAGFGPSQFQDHVVNAAGLCLHSDMAVENPRRYIAEFMSAVTGWERSIDELLQAGERIANIRHAFTLREGDNPLNRKVHNRIIGHPPQKAGPLAGITANIESQISANLTALDWDPVSTTPSQNKLLELGLDDVARDFWPGKEE